MRPAKKNSIFLLMVAVLAAVLAAALAPTGGRAESDRPSAGRSAPIVLAQQSYSASGTHQCRAQDGSAHSCVVTGLIFGSCVEANSSLRTQDCCPSTRTCSRDAQGREQCRGGGVSTAFSMSYCIPGIGR